MCHTFIAHCLLIKIDRTCFEHKSNGGGGKKKGKNHEFMLPVFTTWPILNHVNPCFSFFRCWHVLSLWWTILLVYQALYFRRTSKSGKALYRSFYRAFSWNRYRIFYREEKEMGVYKRGKKGREGNISKAIQQEIML